MCHEGHRGRFLHSPWVIRDFLDENPDLHNTLKLTADFSHFTTVAEKDTNDAVLRGVIEDIIPPFVHHVHCRVGYENGPQVPDPRTKQVITFERDSMIQSTH